MLPFRLGHPESCRPVAVGAAAVDTAQVLPVLVLVVLVDSLVVDEDVAAAAGDKVALSLSDVEAPRRSIQNHVTYELRSP